MKEILCGIYCIENIINKKKYIGLSQDIKRRWDEHRSELRRGVHVNKRLQNSWNTHGEDNFNFYIIELCDAELLDDREIYYIAFYETFTNRNKGYNLTPGGDGASTSNKQVICLLSGKIYSSVKEAAVENNVVDVTMIDWCKRYHEFMYFEEYLKLDEEQKHYYINFDWKSFDHNKLSKAHSRENLSDETLKKYSQSTSGSNNPRAFAIFSPELNEIFWGAKEASSKYGISRSGISSCINGKLQHAGKHPITGEPLTWQKLEK